MTRTEIIEKIQPVACEVFSQPGLEITDSLCANTLPAWTSLSFTQFLTKLEVMFDIKFKMMEILKMQNMGEIISVIEKRVNA